MEKSKFQKDKSYRMNVVRVDTFNGKSAYVAEYCGEEYRVNMYPHQSANKKLINCVYIGETSWGKPMFQQDYSDVLYELYEEGCIYPFTVADECVDRNTQAPYYLLTDEYGFRHRVYNQHSPLIKKGDKVQGRILSVESKYISIEILSKEPPKTSYTLGDVFSFTETVLPRIDFSQLDYEKDKTLRDYQIENKRKIYESWQQNRSVMLQMPTGTGKTRLFVSIARDLFEYGVKRKMAIKVLILAHRKELIEQISEHVGRKYNLAHGIIMSQNIEQKKFPMQIGSVPTMTRRLAQWEDKNFDVIIIDEAHHVKAKSYKNIIALYPQARILGVTATPYRLNGAGFRPEFDDLIVSPSVAEYIKRGFLCEYDYYSIKPDSDLQRDIDRMKLDFEGDYKESEMIGVLDRDHIRARILSTYQKYAQNKKGIIYTISRAHSQHLCEEFNKAGIFTAAIDSETPKEKRDELVAKFRNGAIQVLLNVNIFSEGFDCPDVEVIQLARPTKSLALYLQQVGRGFRPAPGKEKLLILDNVGLYNKFGFPSARRKWRYHFEGKPVDESPAAQALDNQDDERTVHTIFEGDEQVELLHRSETEVIDQNTLNAVHHDYEQSFISYAKRILNEHTAKGYARNIRPHLDVYIKEHLDPSFGSLFYTVDLEKIITIRDLLKEDPTFVSYNTQKHNVMSAALGRYIHFAEWYNSQSEEELVLPPVAGDVIDHQTLELQNIEQSEEDLDTEIESFEKTMAFLKKRQLPIPREMMAALEDLKEKKKAKSNESIAIKTITDNLRKFSLSGIQSFIYDAGSDSFHVDYADNLEEELQDEQELNELFRILNKFNFDIPEKVVQKKSRLALAQSARSSVEQIKSFLREFILADQLKDPHIESIAYSPAEDIHVRFNKSKPSSQITPVNLAPSRKPSLRLRVSFPDGTVISDINATDAYLHSLEKMRADSFPDSGILVAKHPLFDSAPHPVYSSRQLKSGVWICTNLSNDRKVSIINELSNRHHLGVKAILVQE